MVRGFVVGCVALALTACTAERIQGFSAAHSEGGNVAYSVNGFTGPGETDPKDAMKYVQDFGNYYCKADKPVVKRLDTFPFHNMVTDFLRWQAIVECVPVSIKPTTQPLR